MANFDSKSNRGYRIRVEINQTTTNRVRAKLILINASNRFQLYTCTGSMTIDGKKYNYSGQPNLTKFNAKTVLIDKTIDVSGKDVDIDATLTIPTGRMYLPTNGKFTIDNQTYKLPKFTDTGGLSSSSYGKRGGSLSWEIPADSAGEVGSINEKVAWKQVFWCGNFNQGGYIKVQLSDEDDEFLYGVETIKRKSGTETEYNFLYADGDGGYEKKRIGTFKPTDKKKENPFNKDSGLTDMERKGEEVKVLFNGKRKTYKIKELKGKKTKKLHVALGYMAGLPLVTRMYIDGLYYQKDAVEGWEDVPNRYPENSEVVIDSEQDMFYIDGAPKNAEVVQGADWVTIPPGDSELELYLSDWVQKKPKVKIEFEERWL